MPCLVDIPGRVALFRKERRSGFREGEDDWGEARQKKGEGKLQRGLINETKINIKKISLGWSFWVVATIFI